MTTPPMSVADGRRNVPVQRRSAEKVDAILAAARVIMANPDAELTVREIERSVDFSVGTIYRYFESLDAIVDAVLQQHADAIEEELGHVLANFKPESLHQLFSEVAETVIGFYRNHPHYTQLQLAGEYRVRYADIEERSNARLVNAVADTAISAGLMPAGVKPRTRLLVHWSAIGAAFRIAFNDNPAGDRTVLADARRMLDFFSTAY